MFGGLGTIQSDKYLLCKCEYLNLIPRTYIKLIFLHVPVILIIRRQKQVDPIAEKAVCLTKLVISKVRDANCVRKLDGCLMCVAQDFESFTYQAKED